MLFRSNLIGTVIGISSGDTISLQVRSAKYRVRLHEIYAPYPDKPWGNEARYALANKIYKKRVRVKTVGTPRSRQVIGKVTFDGRDINREMVAEGHARVSLKYMQDKSLLEVEAAAKAQGLGQWSLQAPTIPAQTHSP